MTRSIGERVQELDLHGFVKSMEPAEFVKVGRLLLERINQEFQPDGDREYYELAAVRKVLLKLADVALSGVRVDVQDQEQEITLVKMLRASGADPERVLNFWSANAWPLAII